MDVAVADCDEFAGLCGLEHYAAAGLGVGDSGVVEVHRVAVAVVAELRDIDDGAFGGLEVELDPADVVERRVRVLDLLADADLYERLEKR